MQSFPYLRSLGIKRKYILEKTQWGNISNLGPLIPFLFTLEGELLIR